MSSWLEKFRDCEVEVYYLTDTAGLRDKGRLVDFGDGWLELDKGGDTFLVPTTAIRLTKVLSPPATDGNRLLRAVREIPEIETASGVSTEKVKR
jgi:hypothetical protein